MFRRTKASIMAHCEAEDEYIADVLGHSSLSMLPHYRQRSLEKLEKLASEKGYIDKYGELTTFKPRKTNSEKLTTLMKVSTPLCECHRARMLGDCQHKYACLNCIHHRVTLDDILLLENDLSNLQTDLSQAEPEGADRRIIQINELMKLIKIRLNGLQKLLQLIKK